MTNGSAPDSHHLRKEPASVGEPPHVTDPTLGDFRAVEPTTPNAIPTHLAPPDPDDSHLNHSLGSRLGLPRLDLRTCSPEQLHVLRQLAGPDEGIKHLEPPPHEEALVLPKRSTGSPEKPRE